MTNREREDATLSFKNSMDRGAVEETFYPWDLSIGRWKKEGLPKELADNIYRASCKVQSYLDPSMAVDVYNYEKFLGLDGVKRIHFRLPYLNFETKTIEETSENILRLDSDGWQRKYFKNSNLVHEIKPVVNNEKDWNRLKERAVKQLEKYYSDSNIEKIFTWLKEGHEKGEYSIRLSIEGFFWKPRQLLGVEQHLIAFYDYPEMIHEINEFNLNVFLDKLGKVLDILPADVLYIMEDLSGSNGPMLSPDFFDEFVGTYYERLVPFLREKGVKHILVDTDGDFNKLIPNFIKAGIEGFLPMDVNAGMDIVAVRQKYPGLKFIGAFNKLEIVKGKDAINKEFARLLPVIRQGGFIPGCDHQVAPSTSFENYLYYISRLKEVMKEAGLDIKNK